MLLLSVTEGRLVVVGGVGVAAVVVVADFDRTSGSGNNLVLVLVTKVRPSLFLLGKFLLSSPLLPFLLGLFLLFFSFSSAALALSVRIVGVRVFDFLVLGVNTFLRLVFFAICSFFLLLTL